MRRPGLLARQPKLDIALQDRFVVLLLGFELLFEGGQLFVPDEGRTWSQEDLFKLAQQIGLGSLQVPDGRVQLAARGSGLSRLELLLGLGELRIRRVQRLQELGDVAVEWALDGRLQLSRFIRPARSSTPTAPENETAGQQSSHAPILAREAPASKLR